MASNANPGAGFRAELEMNATRLRLVLLPVSKQHDSARVRRVRVLGREAGQARLDTNPENRDA
jgi:hypothetical protein